MASDTKATPFAALILLSQLFLTHCGTWTTKAPMPTKRSDTSIGTFEDRVVIAGGCDGTQICPDDLEFCICTGVSSRVEAYDPKANQWTTLPSMPQARFRHGAAVVGGDMYLIGGRDVNDSVIRSIDVFHSASNSWETLAPSSQWEDAASDLVVVAVGTYIYAISGYTQDYATKSTVSVFDTATKQWLPVQLSSMATSRGDACAAAIGQLIYVFGGFNDKNFCEALNSLEVYDTASNTWTSKMTMDQARGDAACGQLHGEFHVVGGEQKNNRSSCAKYDVPINHVEHYHPPTDSWKEETPLQSVRFRFVGAPFGNSFYVFGGQSGLQGTEYPLLATVEAWEDPNAAATASLGVLLVLCLAIF